VAQSRQGTALGDAARAILEGRADVATLFSAEGFQESLAAGRALQEQRLLAMSPAERMAEEQAAEEKAQELLRDPFIRLIQLRDIRDLLEPGDGVGR